MVPRAQLVLTVPPRFAPSRAVCPVTGEGHYWKLEGWGVSAWGECACGERRFSTGGIPDFMAGYPKRKSLDGED